MQSVLFLVLFFLPGSPGELFFSTLPRLPASSPPNI